MTTLEIKTTISITGTVNSSVCSVECFKYNDSISTSLNSTTSSSGNISITYTVMEGSVDIFCNSTCADGGQGKSNVITITGKGELAAFFGQ